MTWLYRSHLPQNKVETMLLLPHFAKNAKTKPALTKHIQAYLGERGWRVSNKMPTI